MIPSVKAYAFPLQEKAGACSPLFILICSVCRQGSRIIDSLPSGFSYQPEEFISSFVHDIPNLR